jgi:hypothetical protein
VTEPASLPYWLENLLFSTGAVLLLVGVLLVVVGGMPLGKRWWSPTTATIIQFWGATVFVEGLLCIAAVVEWPWIVVAIIAVLAIVAVPWAAWRRTLQLRSRGNPLGGPS